MKKLQCKRGVTITEMLCVVVIVVLLSALLVTGIQLAAKSYTATMTASEAKILCSTLSAAVKNELRYAGTTENNPQPIFFSQNFGKDCYFITREGKILLQTREGTKDLVSDAAYTYGNQADIQISYENEIFTVILTVKNASGEQILAQNHFQVKRLGGTV